MSHMHPCDSMLSISGKVTCLTDNLSHCEAPLCFYVFGALFFSDFSNYPPAPLLLNILWSNYYLLPITFPEWQSPFSVQLVELFQDSCVLIWRSPPGPLSFYPKIQAELCPKVFSHNCSDSYRPRHLCSVTSAPIICGSEFPVKDHPLRKELFCVKIPLSQHALSSYCKASFYGAPDVDINGELYIKFYLKHCNLSRPFSSEWVVL